MSELLKGRVLKDLFCNTIHAKFSPSEASDGSLAMKPKLLLYCVTAVVIETFLLSQALGGVMHSNSRMQFPMEYSPNFVLNHFQGCHLLRTSVTPSNSGLLLIAAGQVKPLKAHRSYIPTFGLDANSVHSGRIEPEISVW
jgi:hypothetical protein